MNKWVYTFGNGKAEGNADMRNLLGGKGANLAEMSSIGCPVPPGFTIVTEACTYYYENNKSYPEELKKQVLEGLKGVEAIMGKKFGDANNPLLFSVRSGARVSMPGMMDTILNLGLNDETVEGLAKVSNNPKFAYDSYRRFIQMYSDTAMGVDIHKFEAVLDRVREENGYKHDNEMTVDQLKEVIAEYKKIGVAEGKPVPQDVYEQLWGAIGAVFGSWMSERAIFYRKLNNIPSNWGTAVNVQCMVFGNSGDNSATGVCFSRDAATGENYFYGEYLKNAQGEDVVAGIRTPQQISKIGNERRHLDLPCMEEEFPEVYKQLSDIRTKLEKHYKDMQDMEFTVENGKLFMLQTRNGKRTGLAALKVAVDMVHEGLITKEEAVMRVEPGHLDQLLHPMFDRSEKREVIAGGFCLCCQQCHFRDGGSCCQSCLNVAYCCCQCVVGAGHVLSVRHCRQFLLRPRQCRRPIEVPLIKAHHLALGIGGPVEKLVSVALQFNHGAVRLTVFENAPPGRHRMGIHSKESKC